jgi:hypothetical protein
MDDATAETSFMRLCLNRPILVIIAPLASLFDIRQQTALKTEHLVAFQDPAYDAIEAKSI